MARLLRTAHTAYPEEPFFYEVPIQVRFNRARSGPLHVGMEVPTVPVTDLDREQEVPLWDFGGISKPLVIVAGSRS